MIAGVFFIYEMYRLMIPAILFAIFWLIKEVEQVKVLRATIKKDDITVDNHFKKKFKLFYYLSPFIKISCTMFFMYFIIKVYYINGIPKPMDMLMMDDNDLALLLAEIKNEYKLFYYVFIIFITTQIVQLSIEAYIIFTANHPISQKS
jgi:hypothetical protein